MKLTKKTQIKIIYSFLTLIPLNVLAGEATLTGYGEVKAKPETVTVMIRVASECYPSAAEVSTTNDNLANKVLEVIKMASISAANDEITASGGYVNRSSGHYTETRKAVCVNTFRKINQIQFKTKEIEKFAQTFSLLQDKIYQLGMTTTPATIEAPTSFVEISMPIPELTLNSQKNFERQALTLALKDAKEKFESTMALAGVKKYRIIRYSEHMLRPIPHRDDRRSGEGDVSAPAPISAPVEFGDLTIRKNLDVQFEYLGEDLNVRFLEP